MTAKRLRRLLPDDHLTTRELAALLQVNQTTVINWSKAGRLEHHKTLGGHRRYVVLDVLNFIASHNMPLPAALAEVPRC